MSQEENRPATPVRVWRPTALRGAEVVHADGVDGEWRVYHDAYCLSAKLDGRAIWQHRGALRDISPGEVGTIQPGEIHSGRRYARPNTIRVLLLDAPVLAEAQEALDAAPGEPAFQRVQTADPWLYGALCRLHAGLARDVPALESQSALAAILSHVCFHHLEKSPRPSAADRPALERARDYLHVHWSDAVTLDELAAACATSKYHLLRCFKAEYGLPPHLYHLHLRLARSKRMLARGVPIVQVAYDCGFSDQAYFTTWFRRAYGVTPGRYAGFPVRRAVRGR